MADGATGLGGCSACASVASGGDANRERCQGLECVEIEWRDPLPSAERTGREPGARPSVFKLNVVLEPARPAQDRPCGAVRGDGVDDSRYFSLL